MDYRGRVSLSTIKEGKLKGARGLKRTVSFRCVLKLDDKLIRAPTWTWRQTHAGKEISRLPGSQSAQSGV